jgi:hypothetical protein
VGSSQCLWLGQGCSRRLAQQKRKRIVLPSSKSAPPLDSALRNRAPKRYRLLSVDCFPRRSLCRIPSGVVSILSLTHRCTVRHWVLKISHKSRRSWVLTRHRCSWCLQRCGMPGPSLSPLPPRFCTCFQVTEFFAGLRAKGEAAEAAWNRNFEAYKSAHPDKVCERFHQHVVPRTLIVLLFSVCPGCRV